MNPRDPFARAVQVAQGFCELGLWRDAWDELEKLEPEERARLDVLRLRLGIYSGLQRWEEAAVLAAGMIERGCADASPFLLGAYAIRRSRSIREARDFLLRGRDLLAKHAAWHFAMACFECQLGALTDAKEYLTHAFTLNPELRLSALEEEDLAPLWDSLSGTL